MNSNTMILNDNLMYLESWMNQNESIRESLHVDGSDLIWNHDNVKEKISLKEFYLPNLLFNPLFQKDIQDATLMNGEDLFKIIRVHILANEYKNSQNDSAYLFITDFKKLIDEQGKEIIWFKDNVGNQYKLKNHIAKAIFIYQKLQNEHKVIKLEDFKTELENENYGL